MSQDITARVIFLGNSASAVRSLRTLESTTSSLRRTVGIATVGLVAGFASGLAIAVKKAGELQQSLNVFQATANASNKQMVAVRKTAIALGKDMTLPATSAKDAADAMLELAKGGLSVTQTMKAARGVLQLSTAAQIDNATAATIVARSLKAFSLNGSDAVKVADVLANAANASTGEITDFALALQQGSAVASNYGLTIQQTTALLAQFADKGIIGADAGTLLKRTLQTLEPTSKQHIEIFKQLGLHTVNYANGTLNLTKTQELFTRQLNKLDPVERRQKINQLAGSDAARGWIIAFSHGGDATQRYTKLLDRNGTAQKIAAAQMKGYKGAVEGFKNALETFAINIGTIVLPAVTKVFNALSGVVNFLDTLAAAPNIHVAIDIAVKGIQTLRQDLSKILFGSTQLKLAPKIDLAGAGGFRLTPVQTRGIVGSIARSLQNVDWRQVGQEVGQGISRSIHVSADFLNSALDGIVNWIRSHRGELADVGAALLVNILVTLSDPAFWLHHWELALAVALAVIPIGRLGRIGGRLVELMLAPLERLLGPGMGRATAAAIAFIARQFERLPGIISRPLLAGLRAIEEGFGRWVGSLLRWLGRLISDGFAKLPALIRAAFKITAIAIFIGAIKDGIAFVGYLIGKVKELIDWIKRIPTPHIPSIPGAGFAKKVGGAVVGAVLHRADGGLVPWNAGVRGADSVPAMLTPGEMVLNRSQQDALGGQRFLASVFGFTGAEGPGFATGGIAGSKPKTKKTPKLPKGHGKTIKKAHARTGSAGGHVAAQIAAINAYQEQIRESESDYEYLIEKFGLDDSDLIVDTQVIDPATGLLTTTQVVDTGAVSREAEEVRQLMSAKEKVRAMYVQLRNMYVRLIAILKKAITQLKRQIDQQVADANHETSTLKKLGGDLGDAKRKQAGDAHDLSVLRAKAKPTKADKAQIKVLEQATKNDGKAVSALEKQISTHQKTRQGHWQRAETLEHLRSGYVDDVATYGASRFDANNNVRHADLDLRQLAKNLSEITGTKVTPDTTTSATDTTASSTTGADQSALIAELTARLGQANLALGIQGVQLPIIGSFAKGTLNVPQTGLALVHAGEQIHTAGSVRAADSRRDDSPTVVHLSFDGDAAWLADYVTARVVSSTGRISIEQGRTADRLARERRV